MTPEDDDRTVIRPPAAPPPADDGRTVVVAAPAPAARQQEDLDNGLPLGTRLGEFEITSMLGEGGFGIVYLATDHSLQRSVALKEYMPSSLAARTSQNQVQVKSERHRETFELGRKSFINEARLLAQFDHASLVKVHRFWEANGTAYMVMPYYEGKTLRDTLRAMGQPPDEEWLCRLLAPLTEALLVIHAEQCYHRDIAPDNVMMLAGSNRPLLLDFGAARRVIGDMTQALTVILKPGYAPVEQYADTPGMRQGPWTDVYALAAVVYSAITGKTPPPSVSRLLHDNYVPLSEAAAGRYSERFLGAIDRALAVRPEQRTQSIGELRQDMGLAAVVFDPYLTKPLPPNSDIPARRSAGSAATGFTVAAPARASAAPAALQAQSAEAPAGGGKRGLWIGLGAAALVAVGCGAYVALTPKPRPEPVPLTQAPQPAALPAVTAGPPVAAAPAVVAPAVTAAPAVFDVSREFARVVEGQTPGFEVRLQTNKTAYRIGRDELGFTIQSERDGFVYVFAYGSDQTLMQLYPNIKQGSLKVRKGETLKLPQSPDVFETAGPAGPTELLVMVSTHQRDHSSLRPQKDGAYRVFPVGAEAAALAAAPGSPTPVMAGRALCPGSTDCAEAYGAVVARVQVVP